MFMTRAGLKPVKMRSAVMEVFQLLDMNGDVSQKSLKSMEETTSLPLLSAMVWMQFNDLVSVEVVDGQHVARLIR